MEFKEIIDAKNFERKVNIIKSFVNVFEEFPVSLDDFKKSIDNAPFYSLDDLKKFTADVVEKGIEEDIVKAKGLINNLSCRNVVIKDKLETLYFEKGTYKDNAKNRKLNRVGQQFGGKKRDDKLTSKEGKKEEKMTSKEGSKEETKETSKKELKKPEDYAKETSDEDLKKFIEKNPDSEHVETAKKELASRNKDGDDKKDSMDKIKNKKTLIDLSNKISSINDDFKNGKGIFEGMADADLYKTDKKSAKKIYKVFDNFANDSKFTSLAHKEVMSDEEFEKHTADYDPAEAKKAVEKFENKINEVVKSVKSDMKSNKFNKEAKINLVAQKLGERKYYSVEDLEDKIHAELGTSPGEDEMHDDDVRQQAEKYFKDEEDDESTPKKKDTHNT